MDIVLAIAIAVVGATMLINPAGIYRFTESWKTTPPTSPRTSTSVGPAQAGGCYWRSGSPGL